MSDVLRLSLLGLWLTSTVDHRQTRRLPPWITSLYAGEPTSGVASRHAQCSTADQSEALITLIKVTRVPRK